MKQEYLDSLIPKRSEFLENLRYKSSLEESYAPIVQKSTEQLIVTLLKTIKPKRVLEIGTAVGYSAILMADNLPHDSSIITIERYKKHADIAVDNVFSSGYEKKIKVIEGEAAEVLHWLDGGFDFIFLDAAKGQYIEFLPDILRLLNSGGVLLSDNILYHGMIEDEEKVERRKITIVKRLHMYLEEIMRSPLLTTSIIPIGDGVALSVKV
ncbi:MAG: O-methyltransferase [Ruminococcaceae bacterium]|nr:O-methyltransferase [Oscillospiraceae bacterium]